MTLINNEWQQINNLIKDIKRIVSKNLSKEANELNNMMVTDTYKSELYNKVEEVEESGKRVTNYEDKLDKIQELCERINKL